MNTLNEVKEYFNTDEIKTVKNESAGYSFTKRPDCKPFQYNLITGEYKFYKTFDGFCKAVLYKIKRG